MTYKQNKQDFMGQKPLLYYVSTEIIGTRIYL